MLGVIDNLGIALSYTENYRKKTDFAKGTSAGRPSNKFGKGLRVICVPRFMLENDPAFASDGLEDRVIAKDIIYKFQQWLIDNGHRGFSPKLRLLGYEKRPIAEIKAALFKEFISTCRTELERKIMSE